MSTSKTRPNNKSQDKAIQRGPKRARTEADDSDEGSNGRHRHRVTRACNECRRRKDRCGGQRPSCKSCVESNRICSYDPSKKRGLRPGYVRAIEALLGLIVTTIDGSEAWICSLLQGKAEQVSLRPASLQIQDFDVSIDFLLEAWRKCALAKEAGKLLDPERIEVDEDGTDSTQYFDTKVAEAFALSLTSRAGDTDALLTPMNTDTTPQEMTLFDSPPTPVVSSHAPDQYGEISPQFPVAPYLEYPMANTNGFPLSPVPQLPKHWSYLMDVYFETTHTWLPISQKHELLRIAYTVANGGANSINSPSSGELSFLHAVMIYASHQASSIAHSSKTPLDHTYKAESPQVLTHSSLFADPASYDLGHVRAFLVLALFEMDQKHWTAAWTAIGRAVYTAISIGLIPRSSSETHRVRNDDVKRTILGCATLETMIAARLGTSTCLRSTDISLKDLLTTDGMEEWEPWQPKVLLNTNTAPNHQTSNPHVPGHVISTFNRLLQVIAQLNDLIHQRKRPNSEDTLHGIMVNCQQNLLDDVPTAFDLPPQSLCLRIVSVATLEMAAAERLLLHRPDPWRPEGYWQNIASLVGLIDLRAKSLGRCSVSPVVQSCLELLQDSITIQRSHYTGTSISDDISLAGRTIATSLASFEVTSGDEPRQARNPGSQLNATNRSTDLMKTSQPEIRNGHIPPQTEIAFQVQAESSALGTLLEAAEASIAQHNSSTDAILGSPRQDTSITLQHKGTPLELDLEDDGLFDSLATLDSADWLANPPEFMAHLGILENPPDNMENIFDMEF
ncbi:fungal-specific transcription factor domain-containing protein [Fusarium flagelliforme]|uniref:fungal-specific transcription factor domain-containing protein n=1 Tax=Fusarium flagelliforme TaxID=2675880 RepID=UPI001E8EB480|nr:fungal-specific transcription factor domain-containing protein [Fusarium flagelliforme]KAH7184535.1 fungal-specific transcription factor domain-containing protein [Fusarium flagelliforme]